MDNRRVPKLSLVGAFLTISGSLLSGYLNIGVVYLFGTPLFPIVVGLFLIGISRVQLRYKMLAAVSVLPLALIGFAIFLGSFPKAEPETYLIPETFRGSFVIDFADDCGEKIEYVNGRRLYRVPMGGALVLNGKRSVGLLDRKFYLVNEDKNQNELELFNYRKLTDERNSRWLPYFADRPSESTVGVFYEYWQIEAFTVASFAEIEGKTKEELETEETRLGQELSRRRNELNCMPINQRGRGDR